MNRKRYFFFTFCAWLLFAASFAQNSSLLEGEIIGTQESVDYSSGEKSFTVNTINNVFDGNFDTYFASYERSGTWVGLDLGSEHIITQIGYSPRISQPGRVELAVIEGANQPDFGDAVPLYIIPNPAEERKMTTANVDCSKGFRYVRYVSPSNVRCNLSELQFYGYAGKGDNSKLYQLTNVPTVTIHTANNEDVTTREYYLKGIIKVISDDGKQLFTDSVQVRGRGNASWSFPKKPYKIKLFKKANLLGLPANAREWTLINNYGDKTLMRNLLAFDISKRFEMSYTPVGTPVDVILNGEYKGSYQLCDQIEVRKNRVNIIEMETTDVTLPNLSGGYLIEVDAYAASEKSWFTSAKGMPITIKSPDDDDIVSQQRNYIVNYFNQMEKTVHEGYMDEDADFRKFLDTESFFKHFLVGEFSGNTDTYWSTYMYKDRNSEKIYTGPVWDFDLAFENDNRTYPINSLNDFIFLTKGSAANGMRTFVSNVIASEQSKQDISDIWVKARESKKITPESMNRMVDSLATMLNQSQELNFKRWPILSTPVHQNPVARGSFQAEVDAVKKYLIDRIDWMDKKVIVMKPVPEPDPELPTLGKIIVSGMTLTVKDFDNNMQLYLYDMSGKLISNRQLQPEETFSIRLFPGAYIVRLHDLLENSNEYRKILVK